MRLPARALLKLFEGKFNSAISAMRNLNDAELDMAYQQLRGVEFSREVLQGTEAVLQVASRASLAVGLIWVRRNGSM